mgnify:FL=1
MPELPEVEVVRRSLSKFINGQKIKKVHIFNRNLRYKIDKNLKIFVENQKVISTKRKSKYLLIELSNNYIILLHLGMTGKIFIHEKNTTHKTSFYYDNFFLKKHNHFSFEFNKSKKIIYNDVRKFGFVKILKKSEVKSSSHLRFLGPDPLSGKFKNEYLKNKLSKTKKSVKNFFMDQKYVSGIGNIYANEILHLSSINPRKKTFKIKKKLIPYLVKNTKLILKKSIKYGGSSIKDFKGISGKKGDFQEEFKVYEREGLECKKRGCNGKIKKIYISNRSSFFCPKCQSN